MNVDMYYNKDQGIEYGRRYENDDYEDDTLKDKMSDIAILRHWCSKHLLFVTTVLCTVHIQFIYS